jgi:hypothetical protein
MRPGSSLPPRRRNRARLDWVDEMVATHGLRRALSAADLEAAHNAGQPAIVGDVEGLDFLEKKLERLEEAHQRGVRHVQLVHYTPNDIGDFQTGAITHQGLTSFGAEVIQACHRLGFVCDVAHATEDTVKQAVKVATKPLLLSHTALAGSEAMGPTPLMGRQVSRDHARAIAETGGSVGIWHDNLGQDRIPGKQLGISWCSSSRVGRAPINSRTKASCPAQGIRLLAEPLLSPFFHLRQRSAGALARRRSVDRDSSPGST